MKVFSATTPPQLRYSIYIAAAFHFFGILGMLSPWRSWFVDATPLNLLLSLGLLLWCQPRPWSAQWMIWAVLAALTGFVAEVIGVNTGLIFGEYRYGTTLGIGLWHTPFLIGLIWLMTTLMVNEMVYRFGPNLPYPAAALLAAIACTLFDALIEPVAIDLGFWSWTAGNPPLHNYIGWLVVSLLISAAYAWLAGRHQRNAFTPWLLAMQLAFFALLNVGR